MLNVEKKDKLDELLYLSRGMGEMGDVVRFDEGGTATVEWSETFLLRRAAIIRRGRHELCKPHNTGRGRGRRKLGFVLVAAILLTMSLTLTVAAVNPESTLWHDLAGLFDLDVGQSLHEGEVELVMGEVVQSYATIEDALGGGGYPVMYPAVLPDGVNVEQVLHIHHGDAGNYELLFVFDDDALRYSVYSDPTLVPEASAGRLTYVVHDLARVIIPISDAEGERYQACWRYGGYGYILTCDTLETLLAMLDDTREVNS